MAHTRLAEAQFGDHLCGCPPQQRPVGRDLLGHGGDRLVNQRSVMPIGHEVDDRVETLASGASLRPGATSAGAAQTKQPDCPVVQHLPACRSVDPKTTKRCRARVMEAAAQPASAASCPPTQISGDRPRRRLQVHGRPVQLEVSAGERGLVRATSGTAGSPAGLPRGGPPGE